MLNRFVHAGTLPQHLIALSGKHAIYTAGKPQSQAADPAIRGI